MIFSIGFKGVHIYDCETCERLYSFADPDDQFCYQIYEPISNELYIGSVKGMIKKINCSNIDRLKSQGD